MSLQEPAPGGITPGDELPVGPTLREVAEQLRLRWRDIVRSAWLAVAILFAVALILGLAAPMFLAGLLTSLVQLALVVLVLVKVLRLLLLGEAPRDGFQWHQREWRMLGWLVVVGLCSAVPAMIIGGIGSVTGAPAVMFVFALLGIAVALWIGVRLMLTTPFVALQEPGDEPGNPLARSWELMKSHTMKALVVALAVGVLTGIVGGVLLAVAGALPWIVLEAVRSIVAIAQPAIGAVVVAVVFGRVLHRPLPAAAPASGYGAATVI